MISHRAHEVMLNTEKTNGEDLILSIHTKNVVTGRLEPKLLIEGDLEELSSLVKRIQRSLERIQQCR